MKMTLLALALSVTALSAFAEDPIYVDSRNMTCSDFQRVLRTEGSVQVTDRWGGREIHYSNIPNCDFGWYYEWSHVPTTTRRYCAAGYVCLPDYRGGN